MPWGAWVEGRCVAGGQAVLPRVLQVSPLPPRSVSVGVRLFAFRWPTAERQVTRRPVSQSHWAWSWARHAFSLPSVVPGWGLVEGARPDGRSRVAKGGPPPWRTTESDSAIRVRWRSRARRAIPPTRRIRAQSGAGARVRARRRWLCSREGRCGIKCGLRERLVRQRASRATPLPERAGSAKRGAEGTQRTSLQSTA